MHLNMICSLKKGVIVSNSIHSDVFSAPNGLQERKQDLLYLRRPPRRPPSCSHT